MAFQREGHKRYGPVFTAILLGTPLTFFEGKENSLRVLLASSEEMNLLDALKQFAGKIFGEDLFFESAREILLGLSPSFLKRHADTTIAAVEAAIHAQLSRPLQKVDGLKLCNDLSFDWACTYVCGTAISAARRRQLADLFHTLENDISLAGALLPIETPSIRRRFAARQQILEIFEDEVLRRLANRQGEADYLRTILDGQLGPGATECSGEKLRTAALSVMGVIFGAHTNTAMALAGSLDDLLSHPQHLRAVLAEQAQVLEGGPLTFAALSKMPMLFRCINESMRLRGNGGLWRKTRVPVELGDYAIPIGSLVGTMMGMIHFAPELYPDPKRYDPLRYLKMKTDGFESPSVNTKDLQYGVFGAGRHQCPGRGLSYLLLGAGLAILLRDYHFTLRKKPFLWLDLFTPGIARPIGPLQLQVTPKTPASPRN